MSGLSLLLSIIALVFSYLAYRKSGGSVDELKQKVEDLGLTTETLRTKTADILNNLEKKVRGDEKKGEEQDSDKTDIQ